MNKWKSGKVTFYNWYDTVTLKPLHPIYVSTVDSGNFVGCLMTVKEGLQEWLRSKDTFIKNRNESPKKAVLDIAFSEELAPIEFKKFSKNKSC
ncbi:hypothetical protein KHA80_00570 [Anaerobacillus sp. HL2]|nr:hypothetical protein KHA80_00570 [Anaerobacillus sp. HL2]